MNDDLVSIGMPIHNGARFLRKTLDSLVAQDYPTIEVIISDNVSTDETERICREYAAKDSRIRYIRQKNLLNAGDNFKVVFHAASGNYFMWNADDDFRDPHAVSALKTALDAHAECGVAMSSYARIYDDGEPLTTVLFEGPNTVNGMSYSKVLQKMMRKIPIHHFFYGLYRKEVLEPILRREFPQCKSPDRAFMCEVALATHFRSVPQVLFTKTNHRRTLVERYGTEGIERFTIHGKKQSIYVWTVIRRLITAPSVPLGRKLRILPGRCIAFVWQNRVMIGEWFPRFFALTLKIKATTRNIVNGN